MKKYPVDKILVAHYTVALGSGGAIRIPQDWRDFFGEGKPVKVLLLPAPGPAVWMFAERAAEALRAIDACTPPDRETEKYLAQFGKPCETALTSKHALLLSAGLRRWLGIRKQVVLVGCYDHAEIMSPKAWKKINSTPDPRLAQAVRELGF